MPPDFPEAVVTLPDNPVDEHAAPVDIIVDDAGQVAQLSEVPQDGIEELKRQLAAATANTETEKRRAEAAEASRETERLAREEAERRAREASGQAQQARGASEQHRFESVVNALNAASHEQSQIESQLATATEEGRFADAAKLQGQLARVASRVEQLEQGKAAIETARSNPAPQQPASQNPKEAYLASVSPKTAAWLRRNDRFFTDGKFQNLVRSAHTMAVDGRGLVPESDEYFRFVEEQAGLRQPEPVAQYQPVPEAAPQTVVQPAAQQRPPVPAAPVSRTVPSSQTGVNGNKITLTPEEREMARHMFPKQKPTDPDPDVVYARHKKAMAEEGWQPVGLRR